MNAAPQITNNMNKTKMKAKFEIPPPLLPVDVQALKHALFPQLVIELPPFILYYAIKLFLLFNIKNIYWFFSYIY